MREKIGQKLIASLEPRETPYDVCDSELTGFKVRVQPSGATNYYVRIQLPSGKRKHEKIGSTSALSTAQARDKAKKLLAEVALGNDPTQEAAQVLTLGEFIEREYRPVWLASKKSGVSTYKRIANQFSPFWSTPLDQFTVGMIDKWRAERLAQGRKSSTINRDVGVLYAALTKAFDWDFIAHHPLAKLKPLKEEHNPIVRFLSPDEERRLIAALDSRETGIREGRESGNQWRRRRGYKEMKSLAGNTFADYLKPMVLLSLNTGMRRGEVFSLEWQDIDFDKSQLTIRSSTAKSGKVRHIPLNSTARETLIAWRAQTGTTGLVFKNHNGKRFDNVSTSWVKVLQDASIDDFRWHDMRHHFASWLVMLGENLNTVRELLGHSDLKMTLRYAHLAPEHKAAAVAKLDKRENILAFQPKEDQVLKTGEL